MKKSDPKRCPRCGITKTRADFYKKLSKPDGLQTQCKTCAIEQAQSWRAANIERARDAQRNRRLKQNFGITTEEYDKLLIAQNGVCFGCQMPCDSGNRLAVDHDHATGIIRGLLCVRCNRTIGFARDNPEILRRLAQYLDGSTGVDVRPLQTEAIRVEAGTHRRATNASAA